MSGTNYMRCMRPVRRGAFRNFGPSLVLLSLAQSLVRPFRGKRRQASTTSPRKTPSLWRQRCARPKICMHSCCRQSLLVSNQRSMRKYLARWLMSRCVRADKGGGCAEQAGPACSLRAHGGLLGQKRWGRSCRRRRQAAAGCLSR